MRVSARWLRIVVCAVGFAACDFPRPPDAKGVDDASPVDASPGTDATASDATASDAPADVSARCGDGIMDPGEEYDDPRLPTECTYSPAQTACSVCNASCKLVPGIAVFCGDGIVHAPEEKCDGGDRGCGACTTNCQTVIAEAATGLIVAAPGIAFIAGDQFTLSDGTSSATFEFTKTGTVAPNHQPIVLSDNDNTAAVIIRIEDALLGTALKITPDRLVGGTMHLKNLRFTAIGNVAIDEHVTTSDFAVDGMSGGQGGLCLEGKPCKSLIECASNVCDATGHCTAP
jgi:hypothetical protein